MTRLGRTIIFFQVFLCGFSAWSVALAPSAQGLFLFGTIVLQAGTIVVAQLTIASMEGTA